MEVEAKVEAKGEAEAKEGRHNENHQHPGHQHQGHQRQGHPQPQRHQHQGYHDQPQKRKNQQERRSSQNHQPQSKKPHGCHQCHRLAVRTCMMLSSGRKFVKIVEGLQTNTNFTRALEIEMGLRG